MSESRGEPELGAPGRPLESWIERPDGSRTPYPLPQTKWDNCTHLMDELGGRVPTDEELAELELTRREYEHFLGRQRAAPK